MAILDGIKGVVKAQVARKVSNSVTHGLKKVAGNLFGVNIGTGHSIIDRLPVSGGKYFTENLSFPENVEGDPQQGHYIIFEIMVQDKAKLQSKKIESTARTTRRSMNLLKRNEGGFQLKNNPDTYGGGFTPFGAGSPDTYNVPDLPFGGTNPDAYNVPDLPFGGTNPDTYGNYQIGNLSYDSGGNLIKVEEYEFTKETTPVNNFNGALALSAKGPKSSNYGDTWNASVAPGNYQGDVYDYVNNISYGDIYTNTYSDKDDYYGESTSVDELLIEGFGGGDHIGLDIPNLKGFDNTTTEGYGDMYGESTPSGNPYFDEKYDGESLLLQNLPTKRLDTAIALYMPPSISVSYGANYADQDIGTIAEVSNAAIEAFMSDPDAPLSTRLAESAGAALDMAPTALNRSLISALNAAAPGSAALIAIQRGKIITPRMVMMFEGIGRRNFSYDFTFIPKSETEAQKVEEIIKKFKIHMHANFVGEDGNFREMEIPSFFNIQYKYKGKDNSHLNRIATCALQKIDVSYGADRFVAYEDGVPQTTKMSLSFVELELMTRDRMKEGY